MRVTVEHAAGDRFAVRVRGHELVTDQPEPDGDDLGATPVELFVAGLTSCVAVLAGRYLARHGIDRSGLTVTADYDLGEHPVRVAAVRLELHVPVPLPPARRRGLVAVASHCTVHNSLRVPPEVTVALAGDAPA